RDESAIQRDTSILESEVRGDGAATDSDEQVVTGESFTVFEGHCDARVILCCCLESRSERVLDSSATERPLQALAQSDVFVRNQMVEALDNRDFGSERTPHTGELDADDAPTKHENALRDDIQS